ncbi:hypothetical protein [Pedobacter sp. SYP-B3415]|uniref:hypothetical protein n=1 Tax=Pedobacter sp. SYP-B3415 TaxID=2496641 RepID=UPI00101E113B|nr:hypothetical protein [Pedobacter sp. SYP-B3415]
MAAKPRNQHDLDFSSGSDRKETSYGPDLELGYVQDLKKSAINLKKLDLKNKSFEQDMKMRKVFAICVFVFIVMWSATVLVILFLSGFEYLRFDTTTLVTLLSTTTANVLALMVIVTRYLFFKKRLVV